MMLEYLEKNPYTLYTIWREVWASTPLTNKFILKATIDDVEYNIITPAWINNAIKRKFVDRLYYTNLETAAEAASAFAEDFEIWKDQTANNWGRIVRALVAEYNPVENYAAHEETTTEHGHVVELAHGHEIELAHGLQTDVEYGRTETSTNEPDGATITTTKSVYGVNSSSPVPSDVDATVKTGKDVDTTAFTGTDTTTNSGTDTTTNSGTDTTTNSGTDTITTDKSGNIGTMTAAQMIKEELAIRMYNVTERAILSFINAYTIY